MRAGFVEDPGRRDAFDVEHVIEAVA